MRYVCLVYLDEKSWKLFLPPSHKRSMTKRCAKAVTSLRGRLFSPCRQQLHCGSARAKSSVTDGPFAETHEQLGGLIIIEARDLNEAIQLAAKIPSAFLGDIEVRPIKELTSSKPL
jgi:hypothetical protein